MSALSLRAAHSALIGAALLLSSVATAQSLPVPPGNNGYYVFVERPTTGPEVLTIHNPDFSFFAGVNGTVQVTLSGQLSNTHNRRGVQTQLEVAPTLAYDGIDLVPHILVPTFTTGVGSTTLNLESAHFAQSVPTTCPTAGASCVLPLFAGPTARFDYDLLPVGAAGLVFAEFSNGITGAGAQTMVAQLQLVSGATPVLMSQVVFNQAPSPFATRMTYDPASNGVVVPLLNGVVSINATTGVASTIQLTPVVGGGFGPRYVVGTNLSLGFNSPASQAIVFGLSRPGGISGHSWGAYNPATNVANFGAADPFGVGRSLAPGFNEVAVSNVAGASVAVLLTATPSVVGGGIPTLGAVGLLRSTGAAPIAVTTTPLVTGGTALGAFGNPELARPTPGDVVSLLAADAATGQQFVAAVGLGGATPLGSLTVSAPLSGGVDVQATDRPWNLPGGNNYVVLDPLGQELLTYTIGSGGGAPSVTLSVVTSVLSGSTSPAIGGSTTVVNIFSGSAALLGLPAVPAALAGLGDNLGNIGEHIVTVGAPVAAPGFMVTFPDLVAAVPFGAVGAAAFVWTPAAPASIATFGARAPVFNFTTALGLLPAAPAFAFPGAFAGAATLALSFHGGHYGTSVYYATGAPIVSELASF